MLSKILFSLLVLVCMINGVSSTMAQGRPSQLVGPFNQEIPEHFEKPKQPPIDSIEKVWIDETGAIHVQGGTDSFVQRDNRWEKIGASPTVDPELNSLDQTLSIREVAYSQNGSIAVATDRGLWEWTSKESWQQLKVLDKLGRQWAVNDVRCVVYDSKDRLWFGTLAGLACRVSNDWQFWTGKEGLPFNDFTCSAVAADGAFGSGQAMGRFA